MEKTIIKENAWNQKIEIVMVESPMKKVSLEEITIAMKKKEIRESIWTFTGEHGNDKSKWEGWN